MSLNDSEKRNRLLWKFRDDLWGLLKKEAQTQKRSAPRQLEDILEERYKPEELSAAEIKEALKLANKDDNEGREEVVARPRKASKKRVNGK